LYCFWIAGTTDALNRLGISKTNYFFPKPGGWKNPIQPLYEVKYKKSISNKKLNINLYYQFSKNIPNNYSWYSIKNNNEFMPSFTKKIFKNISINNLYLGVAQVGVNTSFNLIKKVILLSAPFTSGLSLLPYGPIAIIQAAIAVHSTKILGKLAAKEIFIRSKASFIEPAIMIQNMTFNDPDIFNHINIYFSNKNLNNNFVRILP